MFESYFSLSIAALLPVILCVGLFYLEKYTKFNRLNYWLKQSIIGILFGALAIIGTHWGISMAGAQVNTRDASVIAAGLIFGWPAGIIAGLIGGIERFFGVYWFGLGSFTQIACSVSTIIAGIASGLLRKFIFDDKRCGCISGFFLGLIIEVFHLFMVFVTNINEHFKAYNVVNACTLPMLVANAVSVFLSLFIISLLENGKSMFKKPDYKSLSRKIQIRLGALVLIAFALTTTFLYFSQDSMSKKQTNNYLTTAIDDITTEVVPFIKAGVDKEEINELIVNITSNKRVGDSGYTAVFDPQGRFISTRKSTDIIRSDLEISFSDVIKGKMNETFTVNVGKTPTFVRYVTSEKYTFISYLSVTEATLTKNVVIYINTFLEIDVFGLVFIMMYFIAKHTVNDRLHDINGSLEQITNGNLDVHLEGENTTELIELSDGINKTVDALKGYIDEANKRIDEELAFAKAIQTSVLPSIFPAYPDRNEIDIYASMHTAKEVGGDFYDFYFSNQRMFHFTVADVSGKGIPAALFMMRAKQELKSLTQTNIPINEVFTRGNSNLCEGNEAGMFVTAWSATVNLDNGKMTFANAGHNPPLIKHGDGKFEYLRSKANMVLAAISGLPYGINEYNLSPGDIVFLYTDGVTEDVNNEMVQYGEERLLNAINSKEFVDCKEICDFIFEDVTKFSNGATQFDDITMVAFKYKGTK